MADLETRELQYFLAVADELHFGRAAARLLIAQPALSKAIRRIEARLGVPLFLRSSRHVELTAAGEALVEHGRHAVDAVDAAVRAAQRAGDPQEQLRLVLKPGGDAGLLSGMLAVYAGAPDARSVDILFSGPTDRSEILRKGRADVGLLYAPFDDLDGLAHVMLMSEDRVAVVPDRHRLAGRPSALLADLAGERLPRWQDAPGSGSMVAESTSSEPEVADVVQLLHMVRAGRMIGVLPRSLVEPPGPGLVCVPISDAPPSHLVLAWRESDRRALVASFVEAATGVARDGDARAQMSRATKCRTAGNGS